MKRIKIKNQYDSQGYSQLYRSIRREYVLVYFKFLLYHHALFLSTSHPSCTLSSFFSSKWNRTWRSEATLPKACREQSGINFPFPAIVNPQPNPSKTVDHSSNQFSFCLSRIWRLPVCPGCFITSILLCICFSSISFCRWTPYRCEGDFCLRILLLDLVSGQFGTLSILHWNWFFFFPSFFCSTKDYVGN